MRYIEQWCDTAVSYIRFKPDRPPVKQELLEHMQDKYDGYLEEGMAPAEAERRTIREMGSEHETGKLLNKIHKPYLGWLWRATQWAIALMLILVVWNGIGWVADLHITDDLAADYARDLYGSAYYESDYGTSSRVLYLEPNCSDSSDGYTFTVTKVAYWEGVSITPLGGEVETSSFHFQMEVTNPWPWMTGYTDMPRWFYAVDSLGNYYYANNEADRSTDPAVVGNGTRTGLFTYTFDMWVEEYCSQEAEWLELRYDRDGRDLCLRIDLTGGEDA